MAILHVVTLGHVRTQYISMSNFFIVDATMTQFVMLFNGEARARLVGEGQYKKPNTKSMRDVGGIVCAHCREYFMSPCYQVSQNYSLTVGWMKLMYAINGPTFFLFW